MSRDKIATTKQAGNQTVPSAVFPALPAKGLDEAERDAFVFAATAIKSLYAKHGTDRRLQVVNCLLYTSPSPRDS